MHLTPWNATRKSDKTVLMPLGLLMNKVNESQASIHESNINERSVPHFCRCMKVSRIASPFSLPGLA